MDSKWSFLLLCTFSFILVTKCTEQDVKLKQFLQKTIELVRPEMKNGSSEIGIEVMDPLDVPDYRYEQPGDLISISAYFSHIKIPNLSTFKLENITVSNTSQQVLLKFSFPSIFATGDYIFQTSTMGVPIASANGKFKMNAADIRAFGLVKLSKDSNGIYQCDDVRLKSIENNVELSMEGLASDEILRNVLDPRTVYNEYKPRINNRIADAIKKMLNYALKDYVE